MRPPAWLRPIAVLIGLYLAIMYIATFWMVVWHDWDWAALRWLSAMKPPALSPRVIVLDLKGYDRKHPQNDRWVIADFLHQVVARGKKPAAIVLDFFFQSGDSAHADPATDALAKALDEATHAGVAVYATVSESEMLQRALYTVDWTPLQDLDWPNVYDRLSGGFGHTILNLYDDGLFYQDCFSQVPKRDSQSRIVGRIDVRAMSYLASETGEGRALGACDPTKMTIVRVGLHDEFSSTAIEQISRQQPFPRKLDLDNPAKYVVVAALEEDVGPVSGRSNPELLAWAISDLLATSPDAPYYEPLPYGDMLLALIAVFSLLAVVAFVAVFLLLRRSRLRTLRMSLPWISAGMAALVALSLFAGLELVLLAARHIQPQVTLVGLSVIVAAGLSGERGRQVLFEQISRIDAAPEEAVDYDVFVSYAHDELAWVFENVYQPLRAATLPDGRKFSIFFDTSSIRVGTAWQAKISHAIDGSRFVVPVYSETYFSRPYCRFEARRAHRKWITQGENSRCVLPIMRGHPKIDPSVDDLHAVSVDDDPNVIAKVVAEIAARIGQPPRAPNAARPGEREAET